MKTNRLLAAGMILMSLIWLFHVSVEAMAARTRGLSDAMEVENRLYQWATTHASDEAVAEIFNADRRLLLGGESNTRSFRQMIDKIAMDAVPPPWLGWAGLVAGIVGFVIRKSHNSKI